MTTSSSPVEELIAQAQAMIDELRAIPKPRAKEKIKFAIVMDDKIVTVEIKWETIDVMMDHQLVQLLLREMRAPL